MSDSNPGCDTQLPKRLEDNPQCPSEVQLRLGLINEERGAIGYIVLWLLGVPAGLLFIVFLMRGCT